MVGVAEMLAVGIALGVAVGAATTIVVVADTTGLIREVCVLLFPIRLTGIIPITKVTIPETIPFIASILTWCAITNLKRLNII